MPPGDARPLDRPTRIRVDLDALTHNLHVLRAHAGVPVMAIVKANAYGHGLVPVGLHLQAQGAERLGVDDPRVGGGAGDDQLGPVLQREVTHLVEVDALIARRDAVGHEVPELARRAVR